jgi:hypothetical protein
MKISSDQNNESDKYLNVIGINLISRPGSGVGIGMKTWEKVTQN